MLPIVILESLSVELTKTLITEIHSVQTAQTSYQGNSRKINSKQVKSTHVYDKW